MLTGVVLAGGKSVRYGRNKAFETFEGERLIDRAVLSLRAFSDPVFVVANELNLYYNVKATLIRDMIPHQGPLGGIYSALLFSPNEWVFAKATDMPVLVSDLIRLMLDKREGYDVVVPLLGNRYEPLLALYSRRCIPFIAEVLEGAERKLIAFYRKVRVKELPEVEWRAVDPHGLSFRNINTPEDWGQLVWN